MKNKRVCLALVAAFGLIFSSCHFISSFSEDEDEGITLSFDRDKAQVSIGSMDVINLKASKNQNSADISWSYDDSVIFAKVDNYSAVITGLKPGSTTITASCGANSASCMVHVSSDSYAVSVTNPYVYASSDYVDVKPNETVKVSAALFGGTVADINGFSWTIDKPSAASLQTEGNYCWITGKNDGIAKVTVKHNKAAYGYSFLVNCSSDGTSRCYITTAENIITINLSEGDTADFAVDLVNPLVADYASGFEYKVVDSLGNEMPSRPVVVTGSGNLHVSLKAYEAGECYVRCMHPNAVYNLDILVRVIAQAETAYIEPSRSIVTVSDLAYESVTLSLVNYTGEAEPSLYSWEFSDNADEYIDYRIHNGSSGSTGDSIEIKGKRTGSVKITVSYPDVPARSIVVLVRNITTEASDATCYITTSQNYIRMTPGDAGQQINITLKNAGQDDVKNLKWTITNDAADGTNAKVINWKSGNGTAVSKSASRSVLADTASAYVVIEPVSIGTAYIDISHPKAIYSTRITVVVAPEKVSAPPKSYLNYSSSSSVVAILNGQESAVTVSFSGDGNESDIVWNSDGAAKIAGNGTECVITAPASGFGGSRSTVTASHANADYPVKFTVICYDTEEDYNEFAVKSIYSYRTNETVKTGQSVNLYLETFGFDAAPSVSWSIAEGESFVAVQSENSDKTLIVTGLKAGTAVITASVADCDDVFFSVRIVEEGIIDESKDCYLSTSQNVLYFDDINQSLSFTVELYNISASAYGRLEYTVSDSSFEVAANNNNFTVTSLTSAGSAVLTITHPLSQNDLTVNLRTGNRFEFVNEDTCYISTNQDVFEMYAGQEEVSLVAAINHTEQPDFPSISKGFSFECEDSSVASVSYVSFSNICYIKPLKNGTTKIVVRHPDADFEKEVVVVVNQSPDSSTIPYITTNQNVITAVQGDYATATVSLVNCDAIDNSDWTWTSLDSRCVDVIANNGTSALLSANSPGTAEIKVTHKKCLYALKIIVTVLDSKAVTGRPYIYTDANIITIQKGLSATLTASIIGGNGESDGNYFRFQGSNSSVILVNSVSGAAYIKGLDTGMAYVTVYNSRYTDSYSKTVLVIVEDRQEDGVYIRTSQNILKLKPAENSLTTLTATLVNGEATDGKDFIWWADDYNIIGLTSVAEQCSVMPTGRTGTTKVHVKHAKASRQADIIVMVSNYDAFAFENSSANISTDKLYFFPLQVPSVEEAYEIKYSSSNESVCIIQGSDSVAWVCGLGYGNASLTASMVAADGTVMASSEMLVAVTVPDPSIPEISLGNSIITVEAGTSRTFSAVISGEGLDGAEKFNLKWSVQNKEKGISLLDETADKVAYGSDVYVTFNYGGEYVLLCEHEKTGSFQQIYIIVEEKGDVLINLNSSFETVYKDDGSFTLTAELTNATDADYKNISWSAVKVGGQNIVAVSKANGATCTVTPKTVGQTQVIAKLPNGKFAMCTVVVKANAEIRFDTGTVHIVPGYTEVVNYTTNPENATINWIAQMTTGSSGLAGTVTNFFSIEDDTAKKQLRITGLKDYPGGVAGTVTASMVGASSANLPSLKVYVEYKCELSVMDMNGNVLTLLLNNNPDTKNVRRFQISYYPTDLEIDIMKEGKVIACIPDTGAGLCGSPAGIPEVSVGNVAKEIKVDSKDGIEKVFMTLDVVPHAECEFDMTVRATLPCDKSRSYTTEKSFRYSAYYDKYDIEVVEMTKSGAYTRFKADARGQIDSLELGDGEEAVFYFRIKNENAIGEIHELTRESWSPDNTGKKDSIYCSNQDIYKEERKEKLEKLFPLEKVRVQENVSITPKDGMIYFYPDTTGSDSKETVYHLGHAWDYYKDLPPEVAGNQWEDYKNNAADENGKSVNNYTNEFISHLKKRGVDYWLVSREMVYNNTYYAIPHPGKPKINAVWSCSDYKDDWWKWCCQHIKRQRGKLELTYNGSSVYETMNNGENGTRDISPNNTVFNICTPYVISTDELTDNNVLLRPENCLSLHYYKGTGFLWFDPHSSTEAGTKMQQLVHPYMTPTVSKDPKTKDTAKGTLTITYTNGKNESINKTIPVKVIRRDCEAYTNGNWDDKENINGFTHWTMKDFVDPGSLPKMPYFFVGKQFIETKTMTVASNPELLYVPYSAYPSNQVVTVTIPSGEYGTLSLRQGTYSSVAEKNGCTVYTISTHETVSGGEASGKLYFVLDGTFEGNVGVSSSQNSSANYISICVNKEDYYVPQITSKVATASTALSAKYSTVDEAAHMLIVGDGETVTGVIKNKDTSSNTKITGIEYEPFTASTNVPASTGKDLSAALQKDLVTVSVSRSDRSGSFTVRHTKDYGYFASGSASNPVITDEFYNKKFRLGDVVIDEDSVSYEKAYKTVVQDGVEVTVLDEERTEQNRKDAVRTARLRKLDEQKRNYASAGAGAPKTSCTMPYYYNNKDVYEAAKSYSLTPVGRFVITTDNDYTQEIFVCVKVTDSPCTTNGQYGYAAPDSYYLNVTE